MTALDSFRLDGKVAVVTGGNRGLGHAFARALAEAGARVVIAARDGERSERVASELGATAVTTDITDPASVTAMLDTVTAQLGPVDVLVNNAGILQRKLLVEMTDEEYQRLIASNLTGSFNGMREGAKRVRDGGRIINFSTSIIGYYVPTYAVYAGAKAAVEAMTHVLAKELGARKVTVNAIAPGPVGTDLFLTGASEEVVKRLTAEIPLGRLGEPDDIARVISFLAGPDSAWVNGQVIKANGGRN
jgi:3-oxoacyl-[acyl-carrier protein] reductase